MGSEPLSLHHHLSCRFRIAGLIGIVEPGRPQTGKKDGKAEHEQDKPQECPSPDPAAPSAKEPPKMAHETPGAG
jgi:hypothetical protein